MDVWASLTSNTLSGSCLPEVNTYCFVKENGRWYIDLPDYLEQGGSKAKLELVTGASALLRVLSRGEKKVTVVMDTKPFEGADELELVELCDQPKGGGDYILRTCGGRELNKRMWLCDIVLFIFGDMPDKIYIRKEGR